MSGSSTAPAPTLPSISTAARKTTKSPTKRTCDLDCIEINHPLHTFAEPVNDDDDDFSIGSADFDSDGDNNNNNIAERTYVRSRLYRNKLSLTHLAEPVDDDDDFDTISLGSD